MLTALLPLLESLGAEGGHAASLGHNSGVGAILGKLLGGRQVQPFGDQNELGGAFRQISDLTAQIAQARNAMSSMRSEHETLGNKAEEDERLYGFRDPGEAQRMADLQRQQIDHARQMQLQQQQMEGLQARAAVTMDPRLAAQESRAGMFRRAGALGVSGQVVQSFGPSFLRNLPGVNAASEGLDFVGGPGAQITKQIGSQAAGAASNIAGGALKGASLGSIAGPVGTAVGAALGTTASAAGEIAKIPNRIKDWSESLLESQKTISQFSGVMSRAFALADVRQLRRDITSASRTGGSTAELSSSMQDLYDILRPLKDSLTNVIATDLRSLVRVLSALVPVLEGGVAALGAFMSTFGGVTGAIGNQLLGAAATAAVERARGQAANPADMKDLSDAIKAFNERMKPPRAPGP